MEKITALLENLDFGKYLPAIDKLMGWIDKLITLSIRIGPLCILGLGLIYLLIPPKEANHKAGFRTYFGMGSIAAWLFTQRVSGAIMTGAGVYLNMLAKGVAKKMAGLGQLEMLKLAFECLKTQFIAVIAIHVFMFVLTMIMFNHKGMLRFKFMRKTFLGKLIPSEDKPRRKTVDDIPDKPKKVKAPAEKKFRLPKKTKAEPLPEAELEAEPEQVTFERQGEQVITADDIIIEGLD